VIVVPDEGKVFLLDYLVRAAAGDVDDFWLRIWRNDVPITNATVRSDLTEANFSGYSPVQLVRASWTAPAVVDGSAQSTWGTTFLQFLASSGSQTCYGYFVVDADDNFVLWGERFTSPKLVSTLNPITLLPVMRLKAFV
jgi:hypothetical protein